MIKSREWPSASCSLYPKIRSAARFHRSIEPSVPAATMASPADCTKALKSIGIICCYFLRCFLTTRASRALVLVFNKRFQTRMDDATQNWSLFSISSADDVRDDYLLPRRLPRHDGSRRDFPSLWIQLRFRGGNSDAKAPGASGRRRRKRRVAQLPQERAPSRYRRSSA